MLAQGILPFRYEAEPTNSEMTALAGLPAYLELAAVSGLAKSIHRHLQVCAGEETGVDGHPNRHATGIAQRGWRG